MNNYAHILILAGENSGDQIAADLVKRVSKEMPEIHWTGMGGEKMQQAGVSLLADYRETALMGFGDVIGKLRQIWRLKQLFKQHLRQKMPALLICVDYPGFNLAMAKVAKQLGISVLYYVCPKVWASRERRINPLKNYIDKAISILPFEQQYFASKGLDVAYVGHPLLANIAISDAKHPIQTILLMPGSRDSEIKRLAPLMLEVAEKLHEQYPLAFAIPVAMPQQMTILEQIFQPLIEKGAAYCFEGNQGYQKADYAFVASGTATLELAKRGIPMQVVYRLDNFTYWLAKRIIKTKYISLCNLIADKRIVPELIQHDVSSEKMIAKFEAIYHDHQQYKKMQSELLAVIKKVGAFDGELLVKHVTDLLIH